MGPKIGKEMVKVSTFKIPQGDKTMERLIGSSNNVSLVLPITFQCQRSN